MPFDLMALRMMLLDLILPQKTLLRGLARLGGMRIVATGLDTIVRWLALQRSWVLVCGDTMLRVRKVAR